MRYSKKLPSYAITHQNTGKESFHKQKYRNRISRKDWDLQEVHIPNFRQQKIIFVKKKLQNVFLQDVIEYNQKTLKNLLISYLA